MKSQIILAALTVLVLIGLNNLSKQMQPQVQGETIAEETTPTPSITEDATPSATSVPTKTTSPAVNPTATPKSVVITNSAEWQYPGSTTIGSMKWESRDSADKITDWYEAKIKNMGMSAKSIARTNANDRILNKMAAVSDSLKVRVEISQMSSSSPVEILVVLDN